MFTFASVCYCTSINVIEVNMTMQMTFDQSYGREVVRLSDISVQYENGS